MERMASRRESAWETKLFVSWCGFSLREIAGWIRTRKCSCRTSGIVKRRGNACKTEKKSFFLGARVDTLAGVRYAFEFTQLELLLLRGTAKLPHACKTASDPRT